ncbi:hypothetical protein LguiA_035095 [Lonicera macranthoides]
MATLHCLSDPDPFTCEYNKPDFKELDLGTTTNQNPSIKRSNTKHTTTTTTTTTTTIAATTQLGDLEISPTSSEKLRFGPTTRNWKPGHRRSSSTGAPLIYSGNGSYYNSNSTTTTTSTSSSTSGGGGGACGGGNASSVSSPNIHLYPVGNICPSGKILKSNMGFRSSNKTEKLGSGTVNYGHGSIIKNGSTGKLEVNSSGNCNPQLSGETSAVKSAVLSADPEEVKRAGNELYRRGNFSEALSLYEKAIGISPENASYRSNRAAALTMLGRLGEAVMECEEAVRLDPCYFRAHQRLASLYLRLLKSEILVVLQFNNAKIEIQRITGSCFDGCRIFKIHRLGQVENAGRHIGCNGQTPETTELQKLQSLEKHISRCADARKICDWKAALRECDAAVVAGAVSSPQIISCKAEAFLKLHQLEDADSSLSDLPKLEPYPSSCSQVKFFGMLSEAYVLYVRAQVDMALGRFENAVAEAEKACNIDYSNIEVAMLLNNVKLVNKARTHGKDLFNNGRFTEACSAYGEGLKYNLCNPVLYCNRAVCWSKLGLWEQSVEDCNAALRIQPSFPKALLRRAVSNAKLERWGEAVKDYEVLRKELPGDSEVAEALLHAHEALKKCRGSEEVNGVKFGRAEEFSANGWSKATVQSAGVCGVEPNSSKNRTRKNSSEL